MAIDSTLISTTNTTIFTASGDKMIATMIFCNTATPDPNDETVNEALLTVFLVKSGQQPTNTNKIISNLIVPAGETVFFDSERVVLQNGDRVMAITTILSSVNCTISTVDI